MSKTELIAQIFGLIGMIIIISSFQFKSNKTFFTLQGLGSFLFFLNFLLIGAIAGALFNLTNFVRGMIFLKDRKKLWKLVLVEALYTGCFVFSLFTVWGDYFQIFLSSLPYIALMIMSVFMWKGNGKHIRYSQIIYMSPSWIVYNIFNFTLGGLICEAFNMVSSFIALLRHKSNENNQQ